MGKFQSIGRFLYFAKQCGFYYVHDGYALMRFKHENSMFRYVQKDSSG